MISIIVPSHNPQSYLWDCLDSICHQTLNHDDYETIIVLNGCNEPYKTQIENYIKKRNSQWHIRLIQTDIPGVSNARNIGMDYSIGDYYTFIDDDDLISPCFLEEMLKISSVHCIGCSNSLCIEESLKTTNDNFITKAFHDCKRKKYTSFYYRKFLSSVWGKLFHKTIVNDVRFPVSLIKSEDSVFCFELVPRIKEMHLTDDRAIYFQRKRKGSVMRRKYGVMFELHELLKIENAYLNLWVHNPLKYDPKFVLTRMIACICNFIKYIL